MKGSGPRSVGSTWRTHNLNGGLTFPARDRPLPKEGYRPRWLWYGAFMRELTALREGGLNPYGPPIEHTTFEYVGAVLGILLGVALLCGHVWALLYMLRRTRAS